MHRNPGGLSGVGDLMSISFLLASLDVTYSKSLEWTKRLGIIFVYWPLLTYRSIFVFCVVLSPFSRWLVKSSTFCECKVDMLIIHVYLRSVVKRKMIRYFQRRPTLKINLIPPSSLRIHFPINIAWNLQLTQLIPFIHLYFARKSVLLRHKSGHLLPSWLLLHLTFTIPID